jgi:uncharacterized membrane protein
VARPPIGAAVETRRGGGTRRGYLDWVRGLAVLIMIQAHVLDSWTRLDARGTWQYSCAVIVAGFAAPLFLFCAGLSVALSAGSKLRRHGDGAAAARAVMRRGWWIFFLGFLFRIQAWFLGWSHNPAALLKVDILNVMGPSIVAAGALWGLAEGRRARAVAFAAATAVIAFTTPIVRTTAALDFLPDPLENYLRPPPGTGWFSIFPWTGFVFAGAVPGVLLNQLHSHEGESRLNAWFAIVGVTMALSAFAASFLPSIVGESEFWGGSPAFFLLRTGIMTAVIPFAYVWQRVVVQKTWSPMQQLGRTSLFIYWIHVELVYGLISLKIHKSMTHPQAWAAFAAFALLMLALSVAKDRLVAWLDRSGSMRPPFTRGSGRLGVNHSTTTTYVQS